MVLTNLSRGTAVLATTGILLGVGTCGAFAATPDRTGAAAPGATESTRATAQHPSATPLLGSSEGFTLSNGSAEKLVLTSVSGPNEGVPTVTAEMDPGYSQDYEVKYSSLHVHKVVADFDVHNYDGATIGTAVVTFSLDVLHDTSTSASFTAKDGTKLPMTLLNTTGKSPTIEDQNKSYESLDPSDPDAKNLLEGLCANGSAATCKLALTGEERTYDWKKLAWGANTDTDPNAPINTIEATKGTSAGTTDSWGVAVDAETKIGGLLSVGVEASYDHAVSFESNLTTSASADVDPGYTGFIYGAIPVIRDHGTMTITLGSDTWEIEGLTFDSPDASVGAVPFYYVMEERGDLTDPTTPPSFPAINS